ncbi:MAG: lipopolysaccharide biosynthesis protein [Muribaculaceae bacterium]|nr:lipopolysaccharide biosynthesis protein [Muribaculaceae bacterium]
MKEGKVRKIPMLIYNIVGIWRTMILPRFVRRCQKNICLRNWEQRPDAEEIRRRVDYYFPPRLPFSPRSEARRIADIRLSESHSAYWYDLMRYLRAFPKEKRIEFINGDTHVNPEGVVFGKARRLDEKAPDVALMNLDRRRHFLKVEDPIPFIEKEPRLFFRGDVDAKENRRQFLSLWWGNPLFDLGDTSPRRQTEWHKPRVGIPEHFHYRYILALEGHDVASSLQWICGSNCIPVMTRPTVENWLMHGAMIPGVHYIEIADDFSDAAEKITYYNAHPDEAEAISRASQEWVSQFADKRRENIIHYLVAERYLNLLKN